jgi:hypothetical protein
VIVAVSATSAYKDSIKETFRKYDSPCLQSSIIGDVSLHHVDIGTFRQFLLHFCPGWRLVTNRPDHNVVRIAGQLAKELLLFWLMNVILRPVGAKE